MKINPTCRSYALFRTHSGNQRYLYRVEVYHYNNDRSNELTWNGYVSVKNRAFELINDRKIKRGVPNKLHQIGEQLIKGILST